MWDDELPAGAPSELSRGRGGGGPPRVISGSGTVTYQLRLLPHVTVTKCVKSAFLYTIYTSMLVYGAFSVLGTCGVLSAHSAFSVLSARGVLSAFSVLGSCGVRGVLGA